VFWKRRRNKVVAQTAASAVIVAVPGSCEEKKEEPTGVHETTMLTLREMRIPLSSLIAQLQEAKEQAQELVNTLDVPKVKNGVDPPMDEAGFGEEDTK
jgi:hypothetical protein